MKLSKQGDHDVVCIYNEEKFGEFKAQSVQHVEDLVVGKTYYSNKYPEFFVYQGTFKHPSSDSDYMRTDMGEFSLLDRNVGASYNPWMIFESMEVRDRCNEEMLVTIVSEWENDFEWHEFEEEDTK